MRFALDVVGVIWSSVFVRYPLGEAVEVFVLLFRVVLEAYHGNALSTSVPMIAPDLQYLAPLSPVSTRLVLP
jgi:hypothetical protein